MTSPPRQPGDPGSYTIIDLDLSKYDRIASRFRLEQRDSQDFLKAGIATRNKAFNQLIARIEQVAVASTSPLLLTGPTGVGKSQLARRIYQLKKMRRQLAAGAGALVEVNCATLRGDGAMSALFGHTKGAFTGAANARGGLLREAHNGMLFLDEIGELGLEEQAMLLRAIEHGSFLPVGSDREVTSTFQVLCGTNRSLPERVAAGRFREDLLARINMWTFELPALRDRLEDIEPNLDYELDRWAETEGTRVTFSKEARKLFLDFARSPAALWSGNFRDFGAAIRRMSTLADGGRITVGNVREELERLRTAWQHVDAGADSDLMRRHLDGQTIAALDRFDRVQLAEVIRVCLGAKSISEAGRILFAESRKRRRTTNDADRVRKYLARYALTWHSLTDTGPC